jgi:hypothetical protein
LAIGGSGFCRGAPSSYFYPGDIDELIHPGINWAR